MNRIYSRTESRPLRARCSSSALLLLTTFGVCLRLHAAPGYVESELLIKWKDGPQSHAAALGNTSIGSTVKRNFNQIGWQHVELPPGICVRDGIKAYQALGTVLAIEPNYAAVADPPPVPCVAAPRASAADFAAGDKDQPRSVGLQSASGQASVGSQSVGTSAGVIPNDPMFNQQWYLAKIGATNAWATTTGSINIVVAVLDTGVNYHHPDLAANMWRNPGETGLDANGHDKATNGIDDDNDGYVDDVYGIDAVSGTGDPMDLGVFAPPNAPFYHGTFCAGIIGAAGNNGEGIAGLNWSVQIMAIRFHGGDAFSPANYPPAIASHWLAAWDYVLMMKRRGVNIRVTSSSQWGFDVGEAVRDAIAAAGDEGILNVGIAGNQPVDQDIFSISFPGAYDLPSMISVAASTESDSLTDFSGFGRSTVDLAAPGINITSLSQGSGYSSGGYGTSFACPQVAGAAALLLAVNPNLSVDQMKAALFGSVDQPASMNGKLVTNGRLNVARALEYLTNSNPPAIVIYSSPAGQRTPTNAPIRVTFNRAMNRASVESAFLINPPASGSFQWTDDNRSFSFLHEAPFDSATNYTVRILGSAQDESGATLDGNFNRIRENSPADDHVWTFHFPIPNDDFADARTLTGYSGVIQGSTRFATAEVEESPRGSGGRGTVGGSVWYRWMTPEPTDHIPPELSSETGIDPPGPVHPVSRGWYTFDLTSGTDFDSWLAIYVGAQLDQLMAIAGNDNYGSKQSSRVSFETFAGATYSVVVASKSDVDPNQAGNFELAWYPTPSPGFTGSQFFPASAVPGDKVTLTGTNFTGATSVLFAGVSAVFANAETNNVDLKITAIVPPDASSGRIRIVSPHGNVTSTSSFQVLPPPLSVNFSPAVGLQISWPATSTSLVLEVSEDLRSALWTPVQQVAVMAKGISTLTLAAPSGNRFYRLRTR